MNISKTAIKTLFLLIIIIFIAGILRLFQLGKIPVSMTDDEVRLTYNSYSIWKTAKDINGNFLPLSFVVDGYAFNPIPVYLVSPIVGIFGLNMFTGRLAFAIIGILSVIIIYKLTLKLLNNNIIAIFSALALSFSVWHLQLSRFAYEGIFALFFYLLGILFFISVKKNTSLLLFLAMLSFFLAFYSYSGTKIILIPVISALVWYKYNFLSAKQLIFIVFFIFIVFASFYLLTKVSDAGKYGQNQFFFQNKDEAIREVELERRASNSPEILKKLYHNKFTYWTKIFLDRYSYAFSPSYLFINQEASGIFSIWSRGQLYYIEAPLLVIGILYLFQKKRRETILLFLFLLFAPLASGLGPYPITYTIRSSFMIPWLMIFIGAGLYSFSDIIKDKKLKISVYAFLLIVYIYLIGGYLNQYYFEWSRYGAKYYSKSTKDLIFLINNEEKNKNKIIINGTPTAALLHYAFYNKKISPQTIQQLYKEKNWDINNIKFLDCPILSTPNQTIKIPKNSLYILSSECKLKNENFNIKPVKTLKSPDNNNEWLVY